MKKNWTITLEEDEETKDLILPFPPELLEQLGWQEGDIIKWSDTGEGSFILSKAKDER